MIMVKVKFITFGSNTAIGSFAPDDMLTCSRELATHFVDELGCAVYADKKDTSPDQDKTPATSRKKAAQ
jgi:hypothetical protein